VVVSEETGLISFVQAGQIRRALDATKLRAHIFHALEAPTGASRRAKEKQRADTEAEAEEAITT
jgi:hypothetical protein